MTLIPVRGVDESTTPWTLAMIAAEQQQMQEKVTALLAAKGVTLVSWKVNNGPKTIDFTVIVDGAQQVVTVGSWHSQNVTMATTFTPYPADFVADRILQQLNLGN